MRKILILLAVNTMALSSLAQVVTDENSRVDSSEVATDVLSIDDIIGEEQQLTQRKLKDRHFKGVWDYRSYLNISFANSKLDPDTPIPLGVGGSENVSKFKSDWGLSLVYGRNYRLHKYPIANTLQFYLDFTAVDLSVAHYKAEDKEFLFDSNNPSMPWCIEKYEASYGMNLGPSVTVAPFNYVAVQGLHYVKLNVYYHLGYHIAGMLLPDNEDADFNRKGQPGYNSDAHDEMKDKTKLAWGHGLTSTFGLSLSWKFIGLGYEHRTSTVRYKAIDTDFFGSDTQKFKSSISRFFIQFRF